MRGDHVKVWCSNCGEVMVQIGQKCKHCNHLQTYPKDGNMMFLLRAIGVDVDRRRKD